MAHHDILPSPETVHWGFLDATLPPVLEIEPGDTVTLSSVSGAPSEISRKPDHTVRAELRAIHERLSPSPGPHVLTGPVRVRGAMAGDALRVEILDVQLRDDWGYNLSRPGKGALPDDFGAEQLFHLSIDRTARTVVMPWGTTLPARPFFGIMATAPRPEDGRLTSVVPGYFGGNIDNRELGAGAILHLPVSADGGLFSVGDGHAAQGDGEVCLTAAETGLSGTFRISLVKEARLAMPEAETQDHLIAMAFDADLDVAVQSALRAALRMICTRTSLTAAQAYSLCSMAADVRITQVVNIRKGVHVMIPKAALGGAVSAR